MIQDLKDFWNVDLFKTLSICSCVYCIKNKISDKVYIGSTKNLRHRMNLHIRMLNKNKHHSIILQRAFNKYSIESFKVEILEEVNDVSQLISREQHYLDLLQPIYNVSKIAGSTLGVKKSKETKEKLRLAILGKKHPQWRNELKSRVQLGSKHKKYSDESKKHCSDAQKNLYENGYISNLKKWHDVNKLTCDKYSKSIIQLTKKNEFIKIWDNAMKIKESLNILAINIINCCRNKSKSAYGYKWKFV